MPPVAAPITTRLLEIYRIGPGPSSSHTVGPMRAAAAFRESLLEGGARPHRLRVELKGSLSATGRGHGTDRAVLAGLLRRGARDLRSWTRCSTLARVGSPRHPDGSPGATPEASSGCIAEDAVFVPTTAAGSSHPPTLPAPEHHALSGPGPVRQLAASSSCRTCGARSAAASCSAIGARRWRPAAPRAGRAVSTHAFWDGESLLALAAGARRLGSLGELVVARERAPRGRAGARASSIPPRRCAPSSGASGRRSSACVDRGLDPARASCPAASACSRRAKELYERARPRPTSTRAYAHDRARAGLRLRDQRGERRGRPRRHGADERRGRRSFPAVFDRGRATGSALEDRAHPAARSRPAAAIAMVIKTHASLSGRRGRLSGRGRQRDGHGRRGAV